MPKYTRSQKYKALDKLLNAGFVEDKQIVDLKFKDICKMKDLTKQDMEIIAILQEVITECKSVNPLLKFLSNDEMEVE